MERIYIKSVPKRIVRLLITFSDLAYNFSFPHMDIFLYKIIGTHISPRRNTLHLQVSAPFNIVISQYFGNMYTVL